MSQGGGSTQSTTTTQLPPWLSDAAQGYLGAAGQVAQTPYQPYTGQRVADLSPLQQNALQGFGDLAGGLPSMGSAETMLNNTLQGNYQNPYASQGVSSGGQYSPSAVSAGSNQYMGQNPYFQSTLDNGANDIVRNFHNGVDADTTRMFNLAGAFGGSAHQTAMANNQHELGNQLTNYENQAQQGQYDRSANLAESGLNRGLQAQTANNQFGGQAFENAANRGLQAGQFNANLGSQSYENERQRQMQAVGGSTGLYSGMQQGLTNQLNAGNTERNQQQSLLDSQYGDWRDYLGYPAQQLGIYGNAISAAQGGANRSQTTDQGLPPPDRVGQGLGVMALGNYLGRSGGSKGGSGTAVGG